MKVMLVEGTAVYVRSSQSKLFNQFLKILNYPTQMQSNWETRKSCGRFMVLRFLFSADLLANPMYNQYFIQIFLKIATTLHYQNLWAIFRASKKFLGFYFVLAFKNFKIGIRISKFNSGNSKRDKQKTSIKFQSAISLFS